MNLAPVIDGITVGAERAEVDTDVTLTAVVRDNETPLDQLTSEWKAAAGTFSINWRWPYAITSHSRRTSSTTRSIWPTSEGMSTSTTRTSSPALRFRLGGLRSY